MAKDDELDILRSSPVPAPRVEAKARALEAARKSFDLEKTAATAQGTQTGLRLTERATRLWSEIMQRKLIAAPALAGLVALPIAGYAAFYLLEESPFASRCRKTGWPRLMRRRKNRRTCRPRKRPTKKPWRARTRRRGTDNSAGRAATAGKPEAPVAAAEARRKIGEAGGAVAAAPTPVPMDAARGRPLRPVWSEAVGGDCATAGADGSEAGAQGTPRSRRKTSRPTRCSRRRKIRSRPSPSMSTPPPIPSFAAR